jgi:hypothetical protein
MLYFLSYYLNFYKEVNIILFFNDRNENMYKQAIHIQSLIQENSRLNIKLLPENTEKSKPWWKFW